MSKRARNRLVMEVILKNITLCYADEMVMIDGPNLFPSPAYLRYSGWASHRLEEIETELVRSQVTRILPTIPTNILLHHES